ncbi:MAG TPA: lytic murein transglycosylase [Hyphomicrobiaceae bacterium]|nr:lytic murein transglycosylase [Hyphomicrobiaceae bacterium]
MLTGDVARAQGANAFRQFLEGIWPEAQAAGVSRATFDAALHGVEPDLALPDLVLPGKGNVKGQAEFTKTPAQYLSASYLANLSAEGKSLATRHEPWLGKIEKELGVQRQFVLAIWGRETAFGSHRSNYYIIKALATQAYLGRRKDMFRSELIYALKMLQEGVRTRDTLTGSWAGAMGLTQFMPSEFYTLAYDLDGDGRADIWSSVPDALGSAANQLRAKGWVPNQSWGYEVRLPKDVSCLKEGPDNARSVAEWMRLGVVSIAGAFPTQALDQQAFILTPAGAYGPAFLALENFLVIKRYNMSDLYALFVGNLGDRIAGGGAFVTPWADVQQLSATGIEGIQEKLQTLGYAVAKIDGKAGMNTRALIGAYQKANGLKVDCWPTEALLTHVRAKAAAMGPEVKGADAAPNGGGALRQKP